MNKDFDIVEAKEGWRYVSPLPSHKELSDYYAEQYYQYADKKPSTYQNNYSEFELEYKHFEASLCMQAIKDTFQGDIHEASALELGSGEGFFLYALSKNVKHFKGVDFSDYGMKKFFPQIINKFSQSDIYEYILKNKTIYDIIVLRNVIEHTTDPVYLLNSLKAKISPQGMIVFSFPNDYSLIQKLSKELGYTKRDFWVSPPDHLYYFNTENITKLIDSLELVICDIFSTFPVDLFLLHPGSHYINQPANGKLAHMARMQLELSLWKQDQTKALNLFRQFADNGIGRDVTIIVKPLNPSR